MTAPAKPELHCLHCGYDLRGLPEDRCPECGHYFDRAHLMALMSPTPQPTTDGAGRRLDPLEVACRAAFAPRDLARLVPVCPAPSHGRICKAVYDRLVILPMVGFATVCGLSKFGLMWDVGGIALFAFFVGLCLLFGAWLCETVTAALLAAIVRVRGVAEPYGFWRAITRYTGGFLILTAGWATLSAMTAIPSELSPRMACCGMGLVPVFFWWSLALGEMIRARGEPGWRAWLGCALVPLVGIGSVGVTLVPLYSFLVVLPSLGK